MDTGVGSLQLAVWFLESLLLAWIAAQALKALEWAWLRPRRLERLLREQGVDGTSYRFFSGDARDETRMIEEAERKPMPISHDVAPYVSPLLHQALSRYGKISMTWSGPMPRVTIMDPDLIREILSNKFGHFQKLRESALRKPLFVGLVNHEGEKWAKHRRIVNPAFHLEKLKNMLPAFAVSCTDMVNRWSELIGSAESYELDVHPELRILTADVISRAAFGSSYEEGRKIFQMLTEQIGLVSRASRKAYIPGYKYMPTKENLRMTKLHNEVSSILKCMISKREELIKLGEAPKDDLLGLLMESNIRNIHESGKSSKGLTLQDMIEECKLFYFAGQDTTNNLLTWTILCLSIHPTWQQCAREEVLQVFGKSKSTLDGINQLKIMTMILNEVLRLYPPPTMLTRMTYKASKLGDIIFPPGVLLVLPIIFLHHDPKIWGQDANEFNPERFVEGISKASMNQQAYFPFGWGPRICIGQNFSLLEAKLAMSMILQNFSFDLSPSYIHSPCTRISLKPQHGVQVILHRI